MAKATSKKKVDEEVIHEIKEGTDNPKTEVVALAVLIEEDVNKSLKQLTSKDIISGWKEQYKVVPIVDLNDKAGIKLVEEGKKFIRKQRTGFEKAKDEIKAPFLKATRTIDSQYNELKGLIEEIEAPIDAELAKVKKWETEAEEARAKAEKERLDTRMQELQAAGLALDRGYYCIGEIATDISTIAILPDEQYQALLERVKATAAIIAEQEAEADRLEVVRLAEEQAAREKLVEDQKALADQQAAFLKQQKDFEESQNQMRLQKIKMRSERLEGLGLTFLTSNEYFLFPNKYNEVCGIALAFVRIATDEDFESMLTTIQTSMSAIKTRIADQEAKEQQEATELAEAQIAEQERQRANINRRIPSLIELGMTANIESYQYEDDELLSMGMDFIGTATDEQYQKQFSYLLEQVNDVRNAQAIKEAKRLADIEAAKPEIQKLKEVLKSYLEVSIPTTWQNAELGALAGDLHKGIHSQVEYISNEIAEIEAR